MEALKEQNQDDDVAKWNLFVDGSSNQHGYGIGLILQTPSGDQMQYATHIGFKATHNGSEYEALLVNLRVTTELKVES